MTPATDEELGEVRRLLELATPGPWCVEQCGEKCDAPVIGIAYREDDVDCKNRLSGWLSPYDEAGHEIAYYREPIASEIEDCDGGSASANAALIVAAINALPRILSRLESERERRDSAEKALGAANVAMKNPDTNKLFAMNTALAAICAHFATHTGDGDE